MKQFIKTTLTLIAILLPATAMAYDIEVDGIFYNLNGNEATVTYDGVTAQNSYSSDVIIPETINYQGAEYRVTAIGKNAFNKCDSLLSIVIPNSVTTIGEWAFAYCTSLTEVIIPNSVNHIGNYAFYNCSGLSGVTLPESLTTLPNNLFAGCTALTNIEIPSTVTSIGWGCFSRCNFTEIKIPSALTQIDARAFADCLKLEIVHITDLTSWCTIQFENELSNPLFWADHLYLNGEEIKNLVIPDDVTTIGKYAFYGSDIETVDFGHSVTTISDYAFSECSYLHNFVIPQNVTTIGNSAFYNCLYYLTSVEIPNSVTSIGEKIFGHCMRLTTITVANDNPVFDSRDNCNAIIETATNTLITGCNSTIIPNTVTTIGNTAMYECFKIRSIEIPNSVTIIGKMAFYGCTDLTSINIPNSVTSIGDAAFSWCTSANRIVIPESVTEIGNSAFAPTDYKKIVKCYVPTPLPIDNYTFDRYNNAILRVPTESIELYKSHEYWSKFKNIRPVENIPGDIDDDGAATVKDLAALIQMMLAGNLTPDIGDVNGDDVVDMKDLADLINMLLNS